jgi:hypothetical protein
MARFRRQAKGRHWAYPPSELDELDKRGLIYWPKKEGGWPRFKEHRVLSLATASGFAGGFATIFLIIAL